MKSHLYHLQLNIDFENLNFYKNFMEFMGWSVIFEMEGVIGYKSHTNGDIWFVEADKNEFSDYDTEGVNHISLRVDTMSNVDEMKNYLEEKGIKMLFNTPLHRPEFTDSDSETYYQIIFESPDKILFEIVYVGAK
ncbi:MAG: hypothetical protein WDZ94_00445 [Patescibacteria group bacterium]